MNDKKLNVIGKRIHDLRVECCLSQAALGKILSVSQDTVSLWEKSKSLPPVDVVIKLSEIFETSCDYILGVAEY